MSINSKPKLIFACHPSLYSAEVLSKILHDDTVEILGVVESLAVKRRGSRWLSDVWSLIRGSGLRYAIYLFWITDFFECRARMFGSESFYSLYKKYKLAVIKTDDVNSESSIRRVKQLACSSKDSEAYESVIYFVTVMFNQKLSKDFLGLECLQCINLHPGDLPEYRGVDPVLEALVNDEGKAVVSLHVTSEAIDQGDVLSQGEVKLDLAKSLVKNNRIVFEEGATVLIDWLKKNGCATLESAQKVEQVGRCAYYGWPCVKKVRSIPKLFSVFSAMENTLTVRKRLG